MLVAAACSSDDAVPAEVDSGFDFKNDAFSFANFAHNENGADLTADLTARMCGKKLACANGELPCVATDTAAAWTERVNETLFEGYSEGFAVLSQLFSLGKLDPQDFGAKTAAELKLEHNAKLQAELAYWAATQSVPSALSGDKHFSAKKVMPFLAMALARGETERYRLAIAIKTASGFERGHALVPIGYYRVNHQGVYHLRVYDGNFPSSERELVIDTKKNTWRYEVPLDDKDKLVYEGNADNDNQLYFSALTPRLGKLVCPFDASSGVASAATAGPIQASVGVGDDQKAGFEDGKLVEHGDSRVSPAFANCPTCNPSSGILNFTVPKGSKEDLKVTVSAGVAMGTAKEKAGAELNVTTSTTTTKVTGIKGDSTKNDELVVKTDGSVKYTSNGGGDPQLTHTNTLANGKQQTVTVAIKGADGTTGTTTLNISVDKSGRSTVDTTGLPKGTMLELTYTSTDASGNQVTTTSSVTATGSGDQIKFNADTGAVFTMAGTCSNHMLDKGFELGVDCGDACPAKCTLGEKCLTYEDCNGGVTETKPETGMVFCLGPAGNKICTAKGCMDGIADGNETDVDCGDRGTTTGIKSTVPCVPCKASNSPDAQTCLANSDCDSKICSGGRCRLSNPVYLVVNGVTAGQSLELTTILDGVLSTRKLMLDGTSTPIKIGDAYDYRLIVKTPPPGRFCGFPPASGSTPVFYLDGTTGYSSSTKALDRTETMTCVAGNGAIDIDTTGLAAGTLELNGVINGKDKLISITANGRTTISAQGSYSLSIATLPGQVIINNAKKYITCTFRADHAGVGGNYAEGIITGNDHEVDTISCSVLDCPTYVGCGGDLYQTVSGLPANSTVSVKQTWTLATKAKPTYVATNNYSANAKTRIQSGQGDYKLEVASQPADVGAQGSQSSVMCLWDNQSTVKSGTVTQTDVNETLTCTSTACPNSNCTGAISVSATGVPASESVKVQITLAGSTTEQTFSADGTKLFGEAKGDYTLTVTQQPASSTCKWSNAMTTTTGTLAESDVTKALTCSSTTCTMNCSVPCTLDSDCTTGNDCECGASSGNCAGDTGTCGPAKVVLNVPTSDGAIASGTFTVPASCTQVYIEAWGAAGGTGMQSGMLGNMAGFGGGAGGYVSGFVTVAQGDVIRAWVGQGGNTPGETSPGGTPGIGSNVGTIASGGAADGASKFDVMGAGGDGGGLTSIEMTGSASWTVLVPAGGGGTVMQAGKDVSSTPGTTVAMSSGGAALSMTGGGGGGAGMLGGEGGQSDQLPGNAGTYSSFPSGLSSSDGSLGTPANTSASDYNLCVGTSAGAVKAGAKGGMFNGYGGDGCVVLRCKGI